LIRGVILEKEAIAMKTFIQTVVPCALLCLGSLASAQSVPVVEVIFEKPENYTDVYPRTRFGSETELKQALDDIRRIFAEQGARQLKPGDKLKVTVLDVNLAGEFEPGGASRGDYRIMRGITWPSMKVRYVFTRDGQERSGEMLISDSSYQDHARQCSTGGQFCYEERMIQRWLRRDLK